MAGFLPAWASAAVFDPPSTASSTNRISSGTTPSGLQWSAVATGTALPVRTSATSAFNGQPGAVVYFNQTTGQLQFDPRGYDVNGVIITYTTGTVNIGGTTPGPFTYPTGTTTNAWSPATGTPKTFPAIQSLTGLPPTTFAARVGSTIGSTLSPFLTNTGDVGNIASTGTSGYWNMGWSFPMELVKSGSAAVMEIQNFKTIGQNSNANANILGYGLGFSTFQYGIKGVTGNQVGAVIPVGSMGLPPIITMNVGSGTQTQTQAGYPLLFGSTPVVKTGAGTLAVDQANTLTGPTSVQEGKLLLSHPSALLYSSVTPLAGTTVALSAVPQTTLGGLNPNAGGIVDVGSGKINVTAGLNATDLKTALVKGLAGGAWTGTTGIVSSAAAASVAGGSPRTVGWLDNGNSSVTFAFAAPGDTNLDGLIDVLDATALAGSNKFGTGAAATWQEGDFNYDGYVDMVDAAAFLSTNLYNTGSYNSASFALAGGNGLGTVAAVPEPASLSILLAACAFGAMAACRRIRP
jgi:fibronectin-binding autotransporter adhesin